MRYIQSVNEPIDPLARIALELGHVSTTGDIPYAALSYTWGGPLRAVQIDVNGDMFLTNPSLNAVLQQLRFDGVTSWLWIGFYLHPADRRRGEELASQIRCGTSLAMQAWCICGLDRPLRKAI